MNLYKIQIMLDYVVILGSGESVNSLSLKERKLLDS